ncbi:MAG: PqqD family peptide modification chaperone [Candidatus Eisenbacteria bacterium]|nr:PqqD family peptide modification chaperone [Candidatus Eisenbacteria bacterium]
MGIDVTPATVLRRNPDVVLREEDTDGALLFNPDTNQIRVLNATGLFVWKFMDGTRDLGAVVASFRESFEEVPQEVEAHALAFAGEMAAAGFLHPTDSPQA